MRALNRECADPTSRCHHEAAEAEAEVRRGAEYERAHAAEAEAVKRRSEGIHTPQEEGELDARRHEAEAQVKAIHEAE
jgi:hypothetical protein